MKFRSVILRSSAFLLILLFLVKSGGSLFIHNAYHAQPAGHEQSSAPGEKSSDFNFTCSCVDDFLMPFQESGEVTLNPIFPVYFSPVAHFKEQLSFASVDFSLLRGPPSLVL